jgi:SAM-dependent methyltransferase
MNLFKFIPHKRLLLSKLLLFNKNFIYNKKKLPYFLHSYNASFANERAVEVSIIKNIIKEYQQKNKKENDNILEIGNVLSHYLNTKHTVVDKYEQADKVINEDALLFKPKNKFDLIVAISTFEHIGYDEKVKDPKKIIKVINHLKKLLNKNGKLIFTVPIGYNKYLDQQILKNELPIDQSSFLIRTSKINTWGNTDKKSALKQKYNQRYPNANAIMVGLVTSK